jgi:hypothetical protein
MRAPRRSAKSRRSQSDPDDRRARSQQHRARHQRSERRRQNGRAENDRTARGDGDERPPGPCRRRHDIPIVDDFHVLIGDDQSVLEHLSTFSAYLVRLKRVLARDRSLARAARRARLGHRSGGRRRARRGGDRASARHRRADDRDDAPLRVEELRRQRHAHRQRVDGVRRPRPDSRRIG